MELVELDELDRSEELDALELCVTVVEEGKEKLLELEDIDASSVGGDVELAELDELDGGVELDVLELCEAGTLLELEGVDDIAELGLGEGDIDVEDCAELTELDVLELCVVRKLFELEDADEIAELDELDGGAELDEFDGGTELDVLEI